MKLSIIIPHYNTPHTLDILLRSIGEHDDIEVIVVDDNSTKYIEEYNECKSKFERENVHFFTNDSVVKGAGAARNVGLSHAIGDWLLFADADDYFTDDMYATVKDIFDDNNVDLIYFPPSEEDSYAMGSSNTNKTEIYKLLCESYYYGIKNSNLYIRYHWFAPWSKMIRRKMINDNDIHFDEVMYSNDVMFSAKIGYYAKKIKVILKPIYCVTSDNSLLTKTKSGEAFHIRTIIACNRFRFLKDNLSKEEFKILNHPDTLNRLYIIFKRGYGLEYMLKCYRAFKCSGLKIISLKIPLRKKLKKELKKHSIKMND